MSNTQFCILVALIYIAPHIKSKWGNLLGAIWFVAAIISFVVAIISFVAGLFK